MGKKNGRKKDKRTILIELTNTYKKLKKAGKAANETEINTLNSKVISLKQKIKSYYG